MCESIAYQEILHECRQEGLQKGRLSSNILRRNEVVERIPAILKVGGWHGGAGWGLARGRSPYKT